jgi:transposase
MVARFCSDGSIRPARPRPRPAPKSPLRGLRQIQPNAAGIDVGATVHYVAVPEDRAQESVRHFGCYTPDLEALAQWLQECGVETVAMESTGVYWVPLFQVLERAGFEVKLVDARHVSNVPGKETDVDDCRWLQQLHSYGLLRGCFRPADEVAVLRSYWRQRSAHVEAGARAIHLMQKALEQMNVQLHKALSDISGVTGMKILRAIVAGERDPRVLARHRDGKLKRSAAELVAALTGDWREEHLFALQQALAQYDFAHAQLAECDARIEARLGRVASKVDPPMAPVSRPRRRRKNQPHFDLRAELVRVTGVDLCRIDGIEALTAYTVLTESGFTVGEDFATEKHYASWLGLSPHNKITGGKVRSRRTRTVSNRAATALRVAAQSLARSQSALGAFYRRMKYKHGAPKAITATAHKLACLIYRMLRFGMEYVDRGAQAYEAQQRQRRLRSAQRQAASLGYALVPLGRGPVS